MRATVTSTASSLAGGDEDLTARRRTGRRRSVGSTVTAVAVVVSALLGVVLRAWYLAHRPITSDEAIVGLMARDILHGHFLAFYWGQSYGGVEPYVVAVLFAVFGPSGVLLQVTAAVLAAIAAVLTWRVALRLVADRRLALLAAALAWVAPETSLRTSTYQYGFRSITLIAGLVGILFALRILDGREAHGRSSIADFAGLGLAAGLGWWSSPEIAYFLAPAGLILVGALARRSAAAGWFGDAGPRLATMVLAFVVGALPWLWANIQSGLASLSSSSFDADPPLDYAGRLRVFFHVSGLIETNLKLSGTGHDLVGNPGSPAWLRLVMYGLILAVVLVLAAAFLLCIATRGRAVAIAVGAAVFPLLYAASPATWYWEDGRYVTYLGPLLALMLAVGTDEAIVRVGGSKPRERHAPAHRYRTLALDWVGPAVMAGLVAVSALSTLAIFHKETGLSAGGFVKSWGDPDLANEQAVSDLEAHGITRGYANYWVAYNVDFFSRNRLHVTTISNEVDRSASINREARQGHNQAWLFEVPWNGPSGILEPDLTDALTSRHIPFRVIYAGSITAVVPSRPVTPTAGLDAARAGG